MCSVAETWKQVSGTGTSLNVMNTIRLLYKLTKKTYFNDRHGEGHLRYGTVPVYAEQINLHIKYHRSLEMNKTEHPLRIRIRDPVPF